MHPQIPNSTLSNQRFQAYLLPEIHARLVRDGRLSPALLAQECARIRDELKAVAAFIPNPLVQQRLARGTPPPLQAAYWHGSLLSVEISGLLALFEYLNEPGTRNAQEMLSSTHQLFDGLLTIIHDYSGGVLGTGLLQLSGNAFLAFFDADVLGAQHAVHAVNAALALQLRIAPHTAWAELPSDLHLGLRIGLHSGSFFAATVGDKEHMTLVVAGQHAQRAVLTQESAAPGEIVISEETRALVKDIHSEERRPGLHLLQYMPKRPPPSAPEYWGWESGPNTLAVLQQLVERIDSLQPYLPCGLPRRFLTATIDAELAGGYRPVTVLCVIFDGLNSLLERMGNDAARAALVLNACYQRAQDVIRRYGGSITWLGPGTNGDRLIAFFGTPEANEDDPLRAVRAALDVQAEMPAACAEIAAEVCLLGEGELLQPRMGISTGTAFVGQVGNPLRRAYTVIGAVLEVAVQLATAAGADEIWIAPGTRRLVERHVEFHAKPALHPTGEIRPHTGGLHPLPPAIVKRLCSSGVNMPTNTSRTGGLHSLPPLVGRSAELRLLLEFADHVRQGHGQVVALVAEAGVGKTRLIEEVIQSAGSPHHVSDKNAVSETTQPDFRIYRVECQHYDQTTPYALMSKLLRQILTLSPGNDVRQFQRAVARRLHAYASDLYHFIPVLGDILDLPVKETAITKALSPDQRHERTFELLEALLHIEARHRPLLIVVDDLHWADASSMEFIVRMVQAARTLPLLLVLSYRPGMLEAEPWLNSAASREITLEDIAPAYRTALVTGILGDPPPVALMTMLEQAQGNPFFTEELVYSLIEQGLLRRSFDGWHLHAAPDTVTLPYNIERVITARLARLDTASREVVCAAAVIGQRFSLHLLAGVLATDGALQQQLLVLEQSGLIRAEADGHYSFRHSLLRDITYKHAPYAQRREWHRRAAAILITLPAEHVTNQMELLARHTLLAEEWAQTFTYHLAAGRQAQARHANHEALALYETALAIVPRLTPAPHDQLLELHEHLGDIYALLGQYDNAVYSFDQALALSKLGYGASTIEDQMRLRRQIASVHRLRADFETAFKWLESAMAMMGDIPALELTRCRLLGAAIYQHQGKFTPALDWAQRGLELAQQLESVSDQAHAFKLLAAIHGDVGDSAYAVDLAERSLQLYTAIHDLQGQAGAHNNLGIFLFEMGRWAEARTHYESAARLTAIVGNVYEQATVANNLGDVLRSIGDLDGAIAHYQVAQQKWQQSLYGSGVVAMNLGATYLLRGDLDLAAQQLELSTGLFDQAGAEGFVAELLRYQAELALARGDTAAALAAGTTSLEYAARLGARMEEGVTRRVLGQVFMVLGNLSAANDALEASLELLREVDSRYELARTRLEIADLAPRLQQYAHGQAALAQARETLQTLGARHDLERVQQIASRWKYGL